MATLSAISSQQAQVTENTADAVNQVLDYVATYPSNGITYRASDRILAAHSDASFLTEMGSCSQVGAHIFLSKDSPVPQNNGIVLTISQILQFVIVKQARQGAELAKQILARRENLNSLPEGFQSNNLKASTQNLIIT